MLYGFINRASSADKLKASLDASVQRTRAIADRVARASVDKQGFSLPAVGAEPGAQATGPVDIEAEMVSLADEQLRFETTAKLLEKTYQSLRGAIRER
jgi:MoxR-like ATPase